MNPTVLFGVEFGFSFNFH